MALVLSPCGAARVLPGQDECASDATKDCHNNLQAVLSMEVDLVTTG